MASEVIIVSTATLKDYWQYVVKKELKNVVHTARFHLISDERMVKKLHKAEAHADLNLEAPQTYFEKLWWLLLHNRDPLLTRCTDKVTARDYVSELGLGHILNELYGVYNRAEDIDFEALPARAFIKTTHGSGRNALWDATDPFDMRLFRLQFNTALRYNHYYWRREWNYANIKPRLIAERVIDQDPLVDFRFLCFNGTVRLVYIDVGVANPDGTHASQPRRNIHARDFSVIPAKVIWDNYSDPKINKPDNWAEMVEYAERLSAPFPHCRVDFYNTGPRIIFGEMTFYPGGVQQRPIVPHTLEVQMGEWLDISEMMREYSSRGPGSVG